MIAYVGVDFMTAVSGVSGVCEQRAQTVIGRRHYLVVYTQCWCWEKGTSNSALFGAPSLSVVARVYDQQRKYNFLKDLSDGGEFNSEVVCPPRYTAILAPSPYTAPLTAPHARHTARRAPVREIERHFASIVARVSPLLVPRKPCWHRLLRSSGGFLEPRPSSKW